jgi:hypothetical protein
LAGCLQERVAGLSREADRLDRSTHRRVGHCFEERHPPVGKDIGAHGLAGRLSETSSQLGRETEARIGRTGREPKGAHDAAFIEAGGDVGQPGLAVFLDPTLEGFAQGAGQQAGFIVAGSGVGAGNH